MTQSSTNGETVHPTLHHFGLAPDWAAFASAPAQMSKRYRSGQNSCTLDTPKRRKYSVNVQNGRRLNDGDLFVWNGFASKLGWRDSVTPTLEEAKKKHGIADRDDIVTIPDLIDFDEGRKS